MVLSNAPQGRSDSASLGCGGDPEIPTQTQKRRSLGSELIRNVESLSLVVLELKGTSTSGQSSGLSLRVTLVVMLALSVVGVLLNALDLTRGTHFTNDPQFGLVLSVLFAPFCLGFYLFIQWRGSRADDRLLAFIETTLAARRAG
jgi:hypothetical protein